MKGETVTSPQKKRARGKNSNRDTSVNENEAQNEEGKQQTDDEDVPASPQRTLQEKVKKPVEAFEKLGAMSLEQVNTRSKTKLAIKEGRELLHSTPKTRIPKFHGTPLKDNKFKNLLTLSASKASTSMVNGNISLTGVKVNSALKASEREFEQREVRRKQKEQEALQKKEALMLSVREMKFQQMKTNKEKEKQRQFLSAEKIKEEKLKQMLAEKEAKYLKQKEEAARKRKAAIKKAAEAKLHDATKNTKLTDDENQILPYNMHPTPLLPTPDCYDSDDSKKATFNIPQFQRKENLRKVSHQIKALKQFAKPLFSSGPQTPNLREIFPQIQLSKLKRTSSKIWNETEISILESMNAEE